MHADSTLYSIYGLTVHSPLALAARAAPRGARADVSLELAAGIAQEQPRPWFYTPLASDGTYALKVAHDAPGRYYMVFPGRAEFLIDLPARRVVCTLMSDADEDVARHLFLDQVLPRWRASQGALVVHASAVRTGAGVLGFMGRSGAGKSSTVLALARAGAEVICDDALVIDPVGDFAVHPGHWSVRATLDYAEAFAHAGGDDVTRKVSVRDGVAFAEQGGALAGILLLERGAVDHATLRRVASVEALLALTEHGFHLDPTDPQELRAAFVARSKLANAGLVWRLVVPDDLSRLDETIRALPALLAAGKQRA